MYIAIGSLSPSKTCIKSLLCSIISWRHKGKGILEKNSSSLAMLEQVAKTWSKS